MKRSESATRPGVLLYFDIWPSLRRLSHEEMGRMLEAIFEYAQYQAIPDFEDNLSLALVWDFLCPKLDRDGERYEHQVLQREYARYCRSAKKQGIAPLDFEDWSESENKNEVLARTFQNSTTTSTPTTKTSSSTTAAADTTAAAATTNIYQLTAPQPESKLSPRQQEAEFEALRRERMLAVAGWKSD